MGSFLHKIWNQQHGSNKRWDRIKTSSIEDVFNTWETSYPEKRLLQDNRWPENRIWNSLKRYQYYILKKYEVMQCGDVLKLIK